MWAILGSIEFDTVNSFDSLDTTKSASIIEIEVVNGKPKIQFCGTKLNTISAKIALHADVSDISSIVNSLNEALENGTSLPLIFGNGEYKGDYLLSDLRETVQITDNEANLIYGEYEFNLKENPITEEEKLQRQKEAARIKTQEASSATLVNEVESPKISFSLEDFINLL